MWMQVAEVAARRSTCFRGNNGSVVIKGDDILGFGYNGPPSGEPHCEGNRCSLGSTGGCLRSDHAEQNAINRALKKLPSHRRTLSGCIIYATQSPCMSCAHEIKHSGLENLFYRHEYRITEPLAYLNMYGVKTFRITESGYIINYQTNELVDP